VYDVLDMWFWNCWLRVVCCFVEYIFERKPFQFFLVLGADVTEQIAVEKMGYVNGELCLMQV